MNTKLSAVNARIHDGLPRLNASRCGNNNSSAPGLNQSNFKKLGDVMTSVMPYVAHDQQQEDFSLIEQVVMQGDLSKLNAKQRVTYYNSVCKSVGLNPLTRPFDYIQLNGKLTLYAKKDATEQLRKLHGISIISIDDKMIDDLYIVTATAKDNTGRTDSAKGAVTIGHLKGDAKANAIMKAETKAKRRVTLSLSGMGWTDETEIDSIPGAKKVDVDLDTGAIEKQEAIEMKPLYEKISIAQAYNLQMALEEFDEKYNELFYRRIKKFYNVDDIYHIPASAFDKIQESISNDMEQNFDRQKITTSKV